MNENEKCLQVIFRDCNWECCVYIYTEERHNIENLEGLWILPVVIQNDS